MYLPGARRQSGADHDILDFSGTITSGGTAQTLLPQQPGRCYLFFQNISSALITVGIGQPRATATVSSGKITTVTVNNAGLGFTVIPQIQFWGGVVDGNYDVTHPRTLGSGFKPAKASATLSAGGISAVTVADGGAGYLVAPKVYFSNPLPDLGGGAYLPSATAGIALQPGDAMIYESSFVPTSAVNIFGGTTGQAFVCHVGL